jgi:hypothetical protein
MPDEVVRLPKVSRAAHGSVGSIRSDRHARLDLQGIHAERQFQDSREMPFVFLTRLTAMAREEVTMFNLKDDRSTNVFADLEAQLRALGASGVRLAEAASSLRASARVFAVVTTRLRARSARRQLTRRVLKLV